MNLKRQWGTEKNTQPLSHLHDRPSVLKIALSRVSIVLTIVFWALYVSSVIIRHLIEGPKSYQFTMEGIGYLIVVTFLTFSALMYLVARQGALQRFLGHVRVPRAIIDKHFAKREPSITVLVPSYAEEPEIIRKTLISAALQEYPNMRIVLLLDDNPNPTDPAVLAKLNTTRKLGSEIEKLLAKPYRHVRNAYESFEKASGKKASKLVENLADLYDWSSHWLKDLAESEEVKDHVDVFFTNNVLRDLAADLKLVAKALDAASQDGVTLSQERMHELHRRLLWIFGAKVEVFERKQYASLSHEPNKAMNLNAYIGLMGGSYRLEETPDGVVLLPVKKSQNPDLIIPNSDFILTLDADSMLLKEYCLRLVYFLEQPDNADVAVTQTPYSSYRGASTRIERLSGATTDIQHILHQGMSYYNAAFWVGANAVIRKNALEEIVRKEWVGGFEVKRYIQDNTVIEDTESSIDLALKGWRLVNYPERLSYSATPPDFGSLVVQRRRWANGGLLIMPRLWEQIHELRRAGKKVTSMEILLRLNYMASIAWSNFGLVFLLAYPYDGRLLSPFVLLSATPYFLSMASDLKYCRYRYTDIFRIYGFNLILLPVNLAGVIKSIEQALTSKKIPFARTPKVKNRTAAELPFVLSPLFIIGFSLFTLWRNIEGQNWGNAAFAGFNAFTATWAVISYIGIKNLLVDLWLGFVNYLYVDIKPQKLDTSKHRQKLNWQSVLYHGEAEGALPHTSMSYLVVPTKPTVRS